MICCVDAVLKGLARQTAKAPDLIVRANLPKVQVWTGDGQPFDAGMGLVA